MNRFAIKYSMVVIWNVTRHKLKKFIDGSSFEVRNYSRMEYFFFYSILSGFIGLISKF